MSGSGSRLAVCRLSASWRYPVHRAGSCRRMNCAPICLSYSLCLLLLLRPPDQRLEKRRPTARLFLPTHTTTVPLGCVRACEAHHVLLACTAAPPGLGSLGLPVSPPRRPALTTGRQRSCCLVIGVVVGIS